MIPRFKAHFGMAEFLALFSVGHQEKNIAEFEKTFAKLMGQKEAIALPYGRTGLILLFEALNIRDAEIICPAYTCIVVSDAIVKSGNIPVFIDSGTDYNLDFSYLEKAVSPQTKVLIATSIFGHPLDCEALDDFRASYPEILVIQDCAHSFKATWKGRSVIGEGEAAIFGLNVSKIMSSIFGGMVTTNNTQLAKRLREVCSARLKPTSLSKTLMRRLYLLAVMPAFSSVLYGLILKLQQTGLLNRLTQYYDDNAVFMPPDYLESMSGLEARVGVIQCGKYHQIIDHRRKISQIYLQNLQTSQDFILPPDNKGATYSHFVVKTPFARELVALLATYNIELGILIEYHIPDHQQYKKYKYFGRKFAATLPGNIINLPIHDGIKEKDALRIVSILHKFLKNKKHNF